MAIGNIIYSTSSTTIASGDIINVSDFEKNTKLQVDTTSGNLNINGGVNLGSTSNIGPISNLKISGGSNLLSPVIITDGTGNLTWSNSKIASFGLGSGTGFTSKTLLSGTSLSYKKISIALTLNADAGSPSYVAGTYALTFQTSSGTVTSGYTGQYIDMYKTSQGAALTRSLQSWSGSSAIIGRRLHYSILNIDLVLTSATNTWQIKTYHTTYLGFPTEHGFSISTGFINLGSPLLNVTLVTSAGTFGYSNTGYIWE